MNYMIEEGEGRDDFVGLALMAEATVDHPRAFGGLMNEPMTIWRRDAFQTWRAAAEAITSVIPMPASRSQHWRRLGHAAWLTSISFSGGIITIDRDTLAWIKASGNVFMHGTGTDSRLQLTTRSEMLRRLWTHGMFRALRLNSCRAMHGTRLRARASQPLLVSEVIARRPAPLAPPHHLSTPCFPFATQAIELL